MSEAIEWLRTEPNGYWLFVPFAIVLCVRVVCGLRDLAKAEG